MFSVMLYMIYLVGCKKRAVDLAIKWHATLPSGSKKYHAGGALIARQKKYRVCKYCDWPIYPGDSHDSCKDRVLAEIEADEADFRRFAAAEEAKMAEWRRVEEQLEQARAEEYAYLFSRCSFGGCWDDAAGPSGYCVDHYASVAGLYQPDFM